MIRILLRLLISAVAVLLASALLPGVEVGSLMSAVWITIVLTLLNAFLKPLLILISLPVTLLTFGLFLLVINVFIILLADYLIEGFTVDGFLWALAFSIILSLVSGLLEAILGRTAR